MKKKVTYSKPFFSTFPLSGIRPEIKIRDIGTLTFPLRKEVIEKMLNLSRPSTFGLRDKTVFDPTVRSSREIPLSRIKISKRVNREFFKTIHDSIVSGLGFEEQTKLSIELHSFLINQQGDHFKPHQDTERAPGMVATVTVVLPSFHKGGALYVHHQGRTKRFYSSRSSLNEVSCCAFFADCIHEVKPVTEGYRVVLTFNVSVKDRDTATYTPNEDNINRYKALIEPLLSLPEDSDNYRESDRATVLYYLDHQYTMANLSWSVLKSEDLLTARSLFAAAKELQADAYLVLLDVHETYDAEGGDYYGYGDDESDLEPGELLIDEVTASCFLREDGSSLTKAELSMPDVSTIAPVKHSELSPVEQEYEGFQGNWGNTLEYWYKRAGVIIWRKPPKELK